MQTNIYLMKDDTTGLYKIGKSDNVARRERTLLAQSPLIHVLAYWQDCPHYMETVLHKTFAKMRQRGEWFKLRDDDILYIFGRMFRYNVVSNMTFTDAERITIKEYSWATISATQKTKHCITTSMEWHDEHFVTHFDAGAIDF